jgi:hypothetical protein
MLADAEPKSSKAACLGTGCGVLILLIAVPALLIYIQTGRPWFTGAYGPMVEEALALPVPDSTGDLHSFFVDGTVAKYIPSGTPADRAAVVLREQGFSVQTDSVTSGGFVDQECAACTSEIEGWFREGKLKGNQVIRIWLGVERGRVRYVKARRQDRPPPIQL